MTFLPDIARKVQAAFALLLVTLSLCPSDIFAQTQSTTKTRNSPVVDSLLHLPTKPQLSEKDFVSGSLKAKCRAGEATYVDFVKDLVQAKTTLDKKDTKFTSVLGITQAELNFRRNEVLNFLSDRRFGIIRGGRPVIPEAEEIYLIVWENVCLERDFRGRLCYMGCLYPLVDKTQSYCNQLNQRYLECTHAQRVFLQKSLKELFESTKEIEELKIPKAFYAFHYGVTLKDWELRRAYMQCVLSQVAIDKHDEFVALANKYSTKEFVDLNRRYTDALSKHNRKPDNATEKAVIEATKEIDKFMKPYTEEIVMLIRQNESSKSTLAFGQQVFQDVKPGGEVPLLATFTDWERHNIVNRFRYTILINYLIANGGKSADVSKQLANAGILVTAPEMLRATGQLPNIDVFCKALGRVDRKIRAAKLGDKPVYLIVGEAHLRIIYNCLEVCLVKLVFENGLLAVMQEKTLGQSNQILSADWDVCSKITLSSLNTSYLACRVLLGSNEHCIPVDIHPYRMGEESGKFGYERSILMVEEVRGYLLSKGRDVLAQGGGARKTAFGAFGDTHVLHFHESKMWEALKEVCVPITLTLYDEGGPMVDAINPKEKPKIFEDFCVMEIIFRLHSQETEDFAKTFDAWRAKMGCSMAEMVRTCENVDAFADVQQKAYKRNFFDGKKEGLKQPTEMYKSLNATYVTERLGPIPGTHKALPYRAPTMKSSEFVQ